MSVLTYALFKHTVFLSMKKQAVILVDPLSSGIHLSKVASEMGYIVICLVTMKLDILKKNWQNYAPHIKDINSKEYFDEIIVEERITEIYKIISNLPYNIRAIIPTSETAVEKTSKIASLFNLKSNNPDLSEARRDKLEMRKALRNCHKITYTVAVLCGLIL